MVRHIGATVSQFTPSLNLDFMKGVLPAGLNFTRATQGTYFDSTGTLQTAPINTPRFDYDPITLQLRGLLIEEQRTNLITFSSTLTSWNQTGCTTTLLPGTSLGLNRYAIASGGQNWHRAETGIINLTSGITYSGFILYENTGSSNRVRFVFRNQDASAETVVNGTIGNYSVFSSNSGTITFTDVAISATIRKFTYVYTANFTGSFRLGIGPENVTSGATIVVLAAQFEQGLFATSYIPTTTAAVTRSADVCSLPVGSWYNVNEGTFVALGVTSPRTIAGREEFLCTLGGVSLLRGNSTLAVGAFLGGGSFVLSNVTAPNTVVRIGAAYKIGANALTVNGGSIVTGSGTTLPNASTLFIGQSGNPNTVWNGYISRLAYYPRRLTNTYIQALTA